MASPPHEKSYQEPVDDCKFPIPNGISELQKLQTRIKAVEKVVTEEIRRLATRENLNTKIKLEAALKEIEELKSNYVFSLDKDELKEEMELGDDHKGNFKSQKTQPEISEVRNGILMKDIPLDQVSDNSLYGISRRRNQGADDQMLELWEAAEDDCSLDQTFKESHKRVYEPREAAPPRCQFENADPKSAQPSSELQVEKELGIDKLEVSTTVTEPNQERDRKILKRLDSDAQKLKNLQTTVEDLRMKLEMSKSKKAKNVDFETLNEQLQEVEETIVQLVEVNNQLTKDIVDVIPLHSDGNASADLEAAENVQKKSVSEQARKGSEKIGRLQLEIQKIQYLLLKLEDEKKSKGKGRFSRSRTTIILKGFIPGGRRSSPRRKKDNFCGCFRPPTSSDGNNARVFN